jgi:hypothetical protein
MGCCGFFIDSSIRSSLKTLFGRGDARWHNWIVKLRHVVAAYRTVLLRIKIKLDS